MRILVVGVVSDILGSAVRTGNGITGRLFFVLDYHDPDRPLYVLGDVVEHDRAFEKYVAVADVLKEKAERDIVVAVMIALFAEQLVFEYPVIRDVGNILRSVHLEYGRGRRKIRSLAYRDIADVALVDDDPHAVGVDKDYCAPGGARQQKRADKENDDDSRSGAPSARRTYLLIFDDRVLSGLVELFSHSLILCAVPVLRYAQTARTRTR